MTDTRKLLLEAADIAALAGERRVSFLNDDTLRIDKSLGRLLCRLNRFFVI